MDLFVSSCRTCKVKRILFSSSSSFISSLISLLEHKVIVTLVQQKNSPDWNYNRGSDATHPPGRGEAGSKHLSTLTKPYLCWLFIWSNWSLRSLSSVRSCSRFGDVCFAGSLLGWGSELRPGGDVGCSTAERAFGNREEKDCEGTLLGIAACGEWPNITGWRHNKNLKF